MLAQFAPSDLFLTVMFHVAIAIFCGGLIGLERQLKRKAVGIRSCITVVLTVTVMVDMSIAATATGGDPSRVIAAVITGVGFLGGGVIVAQGARVQGVTTAALIWTLAAVGVAIGMGMVLTAVVLTLIVTAVALIIDWLERLFPRLDRNSDQPR